ncbi:MAG: hypothetical protein RSA29_14565 [Clostridium sp.]|uniref:hypothetical protein n=1 Tax=Clostridium sp. TaxID=1506 RepID=UPI003217FF8A
MKQSKKTCLVLSGAILLSSIGISTIFANESSDTAWSVPWSYTNSSDELTLPRPKTDSTSGYGRIIDGNIDPNWGMSMQLKQSNGNDLTGTYRVLPSVSFVGNEEHYVPSNAYENGYTDVSMYIYKCRGYAPGCGPANGVWSPDSY